ncbi:MAG: hypothetical protein HYS22_06085 [Deltaproteobacteria bacterium]|nr:hypothetical protein [Deltaproteobacteria bacterium]
MLFRVLCSIGTVFLLIALYSYFINGILGNGVIALIAFWQTRGKIALLT